MSKDFPPFYVGERVEAIEDHNQGAFKKGDHFIITSIYKGCCNYKVTVGIKSTSTNSRCSICRAKTKQESEWIFHARRFRSLEDKFIQISYSEVLEKETPLISVN